MSDQPEQTQPEIEAPPKVLFRYKRTRKLDIHDPTILDRICTISAMNHSKLQGAALMGVHENTFLKFLADYPEARDAWDQGRQQGKAMMQRLGIAHAQSDAATWRFLAKQKRGIGLGMSDKPDEAPGALPGAPGEPGKIVSKEEAIFRVAELMQKLGLAGPTNSSQKMLPAKAQPAPAPKARVQRPR